MRLQLHRQQDTEQLQGLNHHLRHIRDHFRSDCKTGNGFIKKQTVKKHILFVCFLSTDVNVPRTPFTSAMGTMVIFSSLSTSWWGLVSEKQSQQKSFTFTADSGIFQARWNNFLIVFSPKLTFHFLFLRTTDCLSETLLVFSAVEIRGIYFLLDHVYIYNAQLKLTRLNEPGCAAPCLHDITSLKHYPYKEDRLHLGSLTATCFVSLAEFWGVFCLWSFCILSFFCIYFTVTSFSLSKVWFISTCWKHQFYLWIKYSFL